LNCFHDWQEQKITESELIDVLKVIENFILRRFICNVQTRGLNKIFASLYFKIIQSTNLENSSFLERLKLILQTQNYPKDIELKNSLINLQLYGRKTRNEKAKLILESLEESYQHKEQVSFNNLTIEHIMPQTLTNWWKKHLGDDYEITHELFLHSLGNLTLTAYNPELSNSEFTIKQIKFKNSHLELNKYFNNIQFWQKEDIEKRGEVLADRALEIWQYFGDESVKLSVNNNIQGSIPKLLRIVDQEYSVKTWRDVLETTLNIISELNPEKFKEILTQFPRFLADDNKNFRASRQLKNGIFIEVNLSAPYIYSFCQKAIEIADLSSEDWQVKTRDS